MNIQYIAPLSRAFSRMRRDLFHPFDLKKWFVVGFTAFLAQLGEFQSPGPSGSFARRRSKVSWEDVIFFPQRAWEWISSHPGWTLAILFVIFFALVIGFILTWISARGKFMFLDNVVLSQARVADPWRRYANEGNSFFIWNFLFGFAMLAVIIAYLWYCFSYLQGLYGTAGDIRRLLGPAIFAGAGLLVIWLVAAFLWLLLRDFVVPIMYRDRIPTSEAVRKFADLLFPNIIYFIGYALVRFCLAILVLVIIVLAGLGTCCVGFLLFAIPYIGSVILLPVSYTLRAYGVEFLEQFGPEYAVFSSGEPRL